MKYFFTVLACLCISYGAYAQAPAFKKQGTATQLWVDGKPMLMLGGELHNSSTSSVAYMEPLWKLMKTMNYNTVLAPVCWETLEPQEGTFDFTLVDAMIEGARKEDLKLVILWFGSWKNGGSIYMPSWVKRDYERFPRVKNHEGTSLEILSTFYEETMKADAKAFRALMQHIKEIDGQQHTVLMMQVQNEIGVLNTPRDFCEPANKAFHNAIPQALSLYLKQHKDQLVPELAQVWKQNGSKFSGTWEEVFGESHVNPTNWRDISFFTEELFMAYYYANYVGFVAAEGKKAYDIPMYVNAWLKSDNQPWTGRHPGGGPLPNVMDMWHCAAPSIDMLSPDIYLPIFTEIVDWYDVQGNPLFVPETRGGALGACRLLWGLGEHNLMGFSPFGVDGRRVAGQPTPQANPADLLSLTYGLLQGMAPIILANQGTGKMRGLFVDKEHNTQTLRLGGYTVTADLSSPRATSVSTTPPLQAGGGLIIWLDEDEYLVIGHNLNVRFEPIEAGKCPLVAIDKVYEGVFDSNGNWVQGRLLNGDETHCSTFSGTGLKLPSLSIQKITLYRYK